MARGRPMSFEIGDRVEFKGGALDHCGKKAEVAYIKSGSTLLLVKMDDDSLGWCGVGTHGIPRDLVGAKGLWWVHSRDLSLTEPKDKTWPGYDID